jgi:carboxyl-terminal processing protease
MAAGMKNRSIVGLAVLSSALVTGGWLVERGSRTPARDLPSRQHLFDEVLQHIRRDYVDTLSDSTLYRHAVDGVLHELRDPHTVFLDPRRLGRLDESTSGHYAGVGIQMDVRDSGVTVIGTLPGSSRRLKASRQLDSPARRHSSHCVARQGPPFMCRWNGPAWSSACHSR